MIRIVHRFIRLKIEIAKEFIKKIKGDETVLMEALPAAVRETLPIVSAKVESTAQCRTVPVSPITEPPKMRRSWLIGGAAQYLEKMKEQTVRKKKSL